MSLDNKIALVTGASRGIGRAIAIDLGKQGASVVGTSTSQAGAESIATALEAEGIKGYGLVLNVSDPASITGLLDSLKDIGSVSILVNNAAITRDNLLMRMKDEEWQSTIETNLNSVFALSKGVLKGMIKARWGRIVNISSVVGVTGNPGQCNYAAAKAGIIGFSKSLAQEVASRNITVNVVAPGFIDTDMTRSLSEQQREAILAQIPQQRLGQVEDIAAAVTFLSSSGADYITGQTLHVNGGMAMI